MTQPRYDEMFSRNRGIIDTREQDILKNATIAIAGMGGVGGLLAERLIRLGVGTLKITDPEPFEGSNINRQFCAAATTLGNNKADEVCAHIRNINPEARIISNSSGIYSLTDAQELIRDCDLVIDEMDFVAFKQSILLQRAARSEGMFYLFTSAIGFGALTVIFDPAGQTLEEYNGLSPDLDVENMQDLGISLEKALPIMPSYTPPDIGRILQQVAAGKQGIPTTSIGVGLASVMAANEAVNILLKKREIPTAPRYSFVDLMDRTFVLRQGD